MRLAVGLLSSSSELGFSLSSPPARVDARDINILIQDGLRTAYMENNKDLRFYADKVQFYNQQKSANRAGISRLRERFREELAGFLDDRDRMSDICVLITRNQR